MNEDGLKLPGAQSSSRGAVVVLLCFVLLCVYFCCSTRSRRSNSRVDVDGRAQSAGRSYTRIRTPPRAVKCCCCCWYCCRCTSELQSEKRSKANSTAADLRWIDNGAVLMRINPYGEAQGRQTSPCFDPDSSTIEGCSRGFVLQEDGLDACVLHPPRPWFLPRCLAGLLACWLAPAAALPAPLGAGLGHGISLLPSIVAGMAGPVFVQRWYLWPAFGFVWVGVAFQRWRGRRVEIAVLDNQRRRQVCWRWPGIWRWVGFGLGMAIGLGWRRVQPIQPRRQAARNQFGEWAVDTSHQHLRFL